MRRPDGRDILSRVTLGEIMARLHALGIFLDAKLGRDFLGLVLFLAENNFGFTNIDLTKISGQMVFKKSFPALKQDIYERVRGARLEIAESLFVALVLMNNRDALVTITLVLQAKGIVALEFPGTTKLAVPGFMSAYLTNRLLAQLIEIALIDLPKPTEVNIKTIKANVSHTPEIETKSFQNLPKQVRKMIYELLFDEARVVKIHTYKGLLKSTCPAPKVLHFTAESRREYIGQYAKLNETYFNLDKDILTIGRRFVIFNGAPSLKGKFESMFEMLPKSFVDGVKNIALGRTAFGNICKPSPNFQKDFALLNKFEQMEKLYWILGGEIVRFVPHHVKFIETEESEKGLKEFTVKVLKKNRDEEFGETDMGSSFSIEMVEEKLYEA